MHGQQNIRGGILHVQSLANANLLYKAHSVSKVTHNKKIKNNNKKNKVEREKKEWQST
jgi:hypothetical protein